MIVLVLEASTTSSKAMLFDPRQGVLAQKSIPYGPQITDGQTRDTDALCAQLFALGKEIAAGQKIAAVGLVSTWHSLVVTDEAMHPAIRSRTFLCADASETTARLRCDEDFVGTLYSSSGCMVNATYPLYQLRYLQDNGFSAQGKRVMDENSYLFYRLTGQWAASRSAVSGSGFLNIHRLDWNEASMRLCGLSREQLPPLCDHTLAAPLSAQGAALLGLPAGTPVAVSEADGAMNQLGAGAMAEGRMTMSIGTSAAVRLTYAAPAISPRRETWCYYGAGLWIVGAAISGATSCIDWFRNKLAPGVSFENLESFSLSQESPYFLPFLFGERCPGWNDARRAAFCGVHADHGLCDLYGAVLEGVLFNLYQSYLALTSFTREPDEILLSGGITHSQKWLQMLADLWQREFSLSSTDQASMLGGAACALHAIGEWPDLSTFGRETTPRLLRPNPSHAPLLQERYARYLDIYAHQAQEG